LVHGLHGGAMPWALLGVMGARASGVACAGASRDRAALARRQAFGLARASSMGFLSGEHTAVVGGPSFLA
jgi:hypothetical protein